MSIVLVVLALMASAPVPVMAVPETSKLFTAVPVRVPPDTLPPDKVPPEMVAPLMVLVQAKAPVELVTVHPVEPDPPPIRISPVEVLPMFTAPEPLPSRLRAVLAPPAAIDAAPVKVRAAPVKVLPLYVPEVVMLPEPKLKEPLEVDSEPPAVVMPLPLEVSPPGMDTV